MYTLRATRTAYPFENGGENRPSKAYFTQLVADAVWENIPLTFNFINQFRATLIVKWDDYTLFELSDSNNKKSYWTNENINKILPTGYELEVNKDIYLSHGMACLDTWRQEPQKYLSVDRAHVNLMGESQGLYSFTPLLNLKKDTFLDNVDNTGSKLFLTTMHGIVDANAGTRRVFLNQKRPNGTHAYINYNLSANDILNGNLYYVFRNVANGKIIAMPLLSATSATSFQIALYSGEFTALDNSFENIKKKYIDNVDFVNQFEGLFYGPNICQWINSINDAFIWEKEKGQSTTFYNILNVQIELTAGAQIIYTPTLFPTTTTTQRINIRFGRWQGDTHAGSAYQYNMNNIIQYFKQYIEATSTTYYRPKLSNHQPAECNLIAWMAQFKNGINVDNILTSGFNICGTTRLTIDFSNGFIATKQLGEATEIYESDWIENANGNEEATTTIYPNGLPSSSNAYIKYVSSVMDTMNTGANQISQNEKVAQGNNIFKGLTGLFNAGMNKDIGAGFMSLAGTAASMGSTALKANQARATMKANYTDKVRTLTSNVYNGSVADIVYKNLHVQPAGNLMSYNQLGHEFTDAGLTDINQRIFLYGYLLDTTLKMGSLFPRPFYNFLSIKTEWLKSNLKQFFPNTNATLFSAILSDLSLGMRVCEVAPDWQTNPVHQVN